MTTTDLPFDPTRLAELCRKNDVKKLYVFGSVARGEATEESDVDMLVEFSKRKSLLDLVALDRQLTMVLGRKIDLLTEAAINPYLREGILRDLRVVYET